MATDDQTPERFYMDDPEITWRYGVKPVYTLVNRKYMSERRTSHKAGSLEKLIENIVKTWEMEATHKTDMKDWGSMDPDKFEMVVNGTKTYTSQDLLGAGSYNALLAECPFYRADKETFESSHKLFKTCFNQGFAWELIDLYSGPPKLSFTWRHWSHFTGAYGDRRPTGELMEIFGSCFVTVDDKNRILRLEILYDPNPVMMALAGPGQCPMSSAKSGAS